MNIPVFVINLDRRPDRLAYMDKQLSDLGVSWERVSALDMQTATDAEIGQEVALEGHRIAMGRGSQCCAVTNFNIYRQIVSENIPAALILQDDVELSSEIKAFLSDVDWLTEGVDLVQFEKYGRLNSARLLGPSLGDVSETGRGVHMLHSRTAGAACYLITRAGAARILDEKPILDMPIDHFLFSPNVSPLFNRLGVAVVSPALARQNMDEIESDIVAERSRRKKTLVKRLRRLWLEVNCVPQQLILLAKGARWRPFRFQDECRKSSS